MAKFFTKVDAMREEKKGGLVVFGFCFGCSQ